MNWKRIHNQNQHFFLKYDLSVKIANFFVWGMQIHSALLIFLVSGECLHVWLHSKDECPTCCVTDCTQMCDKYVGWHDTGRASTFAGSFLCVWSSSRNQKFLGCSVVPCPVTGFMCTHMWQSLEPVPGHHRGSRMGLLQHVWEMEVVPGKVPRWGKLEGSFPVLLLTYLHRCGQSTVCVSSVLLFSTAVSSVSLDLSRVGSGPFVEG